MFGKRRETEFWWFDRENRAFAFSFFYSMLCLGCLLGSVLINVVRDVMLDGAVILGVPRWSFELQKRCRICRLRWESAGCAWSWACPSAADIAGWVGIWMCLLQFLNQYGSIDGQFVTKVYSVYFLHCDCIALCPWHSDPLWFAFEGVELKMSRCMNLRSVSEFHPSYQNGVAGSWVLQVQTGLLYSLNLS